MLNFLDKATLSGVKETSEGFLVADAFAVRTGVQQYAGYEVGRADLAVVNVFRPEAEVFHVDSLRSFSHVPITDDHPSGAVTADNWKKLAVGEASAEVLRDGERLRIPLILKDKAAIDRVKDGKRELSAGYSCDLAFEDGVAPDGTPYQAVQRNIRANHIAIVAKGRAGSQFKIGDSAPDWGVSPVQDKEFPVNLRTIQFDGISISVTDQAEQAIAKLQKLLGDAATAIETATAAHTAAIATKDTEIGTLKGQIEALQKQVLTGDALDAAVTARASLIADAKKVVPTLEIKGLSDAQIRRAVVAAKFGDEMAKAEVSDAEILGLFKAATRDGQSAAPGIIPPVADPVRAALQTRDAPATVKDNGQAAYEQRLNDAWKTGGMAAPAAPAAAAA